MNTYQWRVHQAQKSPPKGLDREFEVTRTYAEAARHVGNTEGVPVLDLWNMFWNACGQKEERLSEYLTDGLHLNQLGYSVSLMNEINDIQRADDLNLEIKAYV